MKRAKNPSKYAALLPLAFVLQTMLFFLGLLLLGIPGAAAGSGSASLPHLITMLIGMGRVFLLSALILGLLAAHKRILHGKGRAYPALGILFLTTAALLYFSLFGLERMREAREMSSPASYNPLVEDRLFRTDGKYLWIGKDEGFTVKAVLVHEGLEGRKGFHVYPQAVYVPEKNALRVLSAGEDIPLAETFPVRLPRILKLLEADLAYIAGAASPKYLVDLPAAFFCLALSLFFVSLHTILRLSRWPLFNFLFSVIFIFLVFTMYRFFCLQILPEVNKIFSPGPAAYAPLLFVVVPGFFLSLFGLLMRPLSEWRRDIEYE